ncbi:MAG: FAD-binding oxidoreductase [Cyanobacteria bacterium P01_H01_bin.15]
MNEATLLPKRFWSISDDQGRSNAKIYRIQKEKFQFKGDEIRGLFKKYKPSSRAWITAGAGHSSRALPDNCFVLQFNGPRTFNESPSSWFDASSSIRDVLTDLSRQNQTLPVVPSEPDVSIGGIISAGGYGAHSVRWGAFCDHVKAMDVVTADGELTRCSPQKNKELFHKVCFGMGGGGLILRAQLNTIPRQTQSMTYHQWKFNNLKDLTLFASQLETFLKQIEYLKGQFWNNGYFLSILVPGSLQKLIQRLPKFNASVVYEGHDLDIRDRIAGRISAKGMSLTQQRWFDYVLPFAALPDFMSKVREVTPRYILNSGDFRILMLLSRLGGNASAFSDLSPVQKIDGEYAWGVGCYFGPRISAELRNNQRISAIHSYLATLCSDLGGEAYLPASPPFPVAVLQKFSVGRKILQLLDFDKSCEQACFRSHLLRSRIQPSDLLAWKRIEDS